MEGKFENGRARLRVQPAVPTPYRSVPADQLNRFVSGDRTRGGAVESGTDIAGVVKPVVKPVVVEGTVTERVVVESVMLARRLSSSDFPKDHKGRVGLVHDILDEFDDR